MRRHVNSGEHLASMTSSPAAYLVFRSMERLAQDPSISEDAEKDPVSRALYQAILQRPHSSEIVSSIEHMAEVRFRDMGGIAIHDIRTEDINGSAIAIPRKRFRRQPEEHAATSSELVGIIRSANTVFFSSYIEDFNDRDLVTPKLWAPYLDILEYALTNEVNSKQVINYFSNMFVRRVATNFPGRYMPVELVLQSLQSRYPYGVRLADFGSSVGAGINWQLRKTTSHPKIKPMEFAEVSDFQPGKSDLTERANEMLQNLPILREVVAIDIQDVVHPFKPKYNPSFVEWAFGSFRASERHNPEFKEMYFELLRRVPGNVTFHMGNLLLTDHLAQFKEEHPEKFDVMVMNTSLHQNPPAERKKIIDLGLSLLNEEGLLLISDFAYLNPRSHRRRAPTGPVPKDAFRTFDFWHTNFNYRTFAIDKAHPKGIGLQEIAKYRDNSRCTSMTVMPATFAIGKGTYRLSSLIKRQGEI